MEAPPKVPPIAMPEPLAGVPTGSIKYSAPATVTPARTEVIGALSATLTVPLVGFGFTVTVPVVGPVDALFNTPVANEPQLEVEVALSVCLPWT